MSIEEANDTARRTLVALMNLRGMTAAELGRRTGIGRNIQIFVKDGGGRITAGHLVAFAEALDVDPAVMLMDPADAAAWAIEHRPGEPIWHRRRRVVTARVPAAATDRYRIPRGRTVRRRRAPALSAPRQLAA